MSTTVKDNGGGDFTPAPAGTHVARCIRVIDLGTQYSQVYNKHQPKIMVVWELPDELMEPGEDGVAKPYTVSNWYTASLGEKANLRHHLESWRGRAFTAEELDGFSLRNILDKPCMLSVVHATKDTKTYANISAVMALPKSTVCPDRINNLMLFDVDEPDMAILESLSDGIQKLIMGSLEWQGRSVAPGAAADSAAATVDEDDLPF